MNFPENEIERSADLHGSIPFWSWNDKLQPEELQRQIRNMKSLGMRGFFMHARGGLETPYLSDAWFDCVDACISEAEKCGMEAWAYDENGWPSGFAGGALLEDPANHAVYLTCGTEEAYPPPVEEVLGVYVLEDNRLRRLSGPEEGSAPYIVIRKKRDSSYVDTMRADITEKFIRATHEVYQKRVAKGKFGGVMPGFFTDEPQYYRWATPFSEIFPEEFEKRCGYSVYEMLPALFLDVEGAEEFRYDYYLLCHTLFIRNFVRVIYEWCEQNGVRLTGHAVEESSLAGQMWSCGGVMPFYRYEHIPGIDYLGRGIGNTLAPKQLGSVCAQLGKKQAISEMFGCCGWDVTPKELKRIAELQYSCGVNLMCQHLYSYSIRGQRKRDYPCHYSEHTPWQRYLSEFDRYFNRLGAALSLGEEYAPVLVIHPVHSAYLHYKRQDESGVRELDAALDRLVRTFAERQIPYHFGDETMMAELALVKGGTILVGRCEYSTVVLPDCETLDRTTAELLRDYMKNGGRLYCFGRLPDRIDGRRADLSFLHSNMSFEALCGLSGIRVEGSGGKPVPLHMMVRVTPQGRLLYFANVSSAPLGGVRIYVRDCKGLVRLRLEGEEMVRQPVLSEHLPDGSLCVTCDFGESESYLLVPQSGVAGTVKDAQTAGAAHAEACGCANRAERRALGTAAEPECADGKPLPEVQTDCGCESREMLHAEAGSAAAHSTGAVQSTVLLRSAAELPAVSGQMTEAVPGKGGGAANTGAADFLAVPREFHFVKRPENALTLDYARVRLDDGTESEPLPVMCIKDMLLRRRYAGKVTMTYSFRLETVPERLRIVFEPMLYTDIRVNGAEAAPLEGEWWLDRSFQVLPLEAMVSPGVNTVSFTFEYWQREEVYRVLYGGGSESLRNCLDFDCEIEPVYLTGLFCVRSESPFLRDAGQTVTTRGGFVLTPQSDAVDIRNLVTCGYPFFAGQLEVEADLLWHPGMPEKIRLGGRYAVCKVALNGEACGIAMFEDTVSLSGRLRDGVNRLVLTLCGSLRNLLGPHHDLNPEPLSVGPVTFSGEKRWQGTSCPSYTDRYAFVRFGLDTV